jgi:hypothetical protein
MDIKGLRLEENTAEDGGDVHGELEDSKDRLGFLSRRIWEAKQRKKLFTSVEGRQTAESGPGRLLSLTSIMRFAVAFLVASRLGPIAKDTCFLPLVWPHGIIGHLGETFGSFTASTAPTLEFLSTKSRL